MFLTVIARIRHYKKEVNRLQCETARVWNKQ